MAEFITQNIEYPDIDICFRGTVYTSFIIKENGEITSIRILKSFGLPEVDNAVLKVIQKMPKWLPGLCSGVEVAVEFVLPIRFHL